MLSNRLFNIRKNCNFRINKSNQLYFIKYHRRITSLSGNDEIKAKSLLDDVRKPSRQLEKNYCPVR